MSIVGLTSENLLPQYLLLKRVSSFGQICMLHSKTIVGEEFLPSATQKIS